MKMKIYNKRQFKYPKQDIHSLFTRCGNDAYHFITESLIAHCKEENILEENIACLVCEEKSGGGQSTRSSSDRPGGSQTPNQFVYSRSPPFYIQNLLAKSEASRKRTRALQVSGSVSLNFCRVLLTCDVTILFNLYLP